MSYVHLKYEADTPTVNYCGLLSSLPVHSWVASSQRHLLHSLFYSHSLLDHHCNISLGKLHDAHSVHWSEIKRRRSPERFWYEEREMTQNMRHIRYEASVSYFSLHINIIIMAHSCSAYHVSIPNPNIVIAIPRCEEGDFKIKGFTIVSWSFAPSSTICADAHMRTNPKPSRAHGQIKATRVHRWQASMSCRICRMRQNRQRQ